MSEERTVYHTAHAESETSGPEMRLFVASDGQVSTWDEERQCWIKADTSIGEHTCICRICGCTWDRTNHA